MRILVEVRHNFILSTLIVSKEACCFCYFVLRSHCNNLTLLVVEWRITQLGILMRYKARLPPPYFDSSGTSSLKASDESLGRDETYICKASLCIYSPSFNK